jgi:hypothetical protein
MSAVATPPAPPLPTKPATKAIDQEKLNRITAIFCEVLDGTNYDGAIQKAIDIESRLAQAAS